ncbi:MAG: hypothetical protein ACYS18_08170 [Planctomycetota bacterium]|jgi:hypothetical protein
MRKNKANQTQYKAKTNPFFLPKTPIKAKTNPIQTQANPISIGLPRQKFTRHSFCEGGPPAELRNSARQKIQKEKAEKYKYDVIKRKPTR